MTVPVQILLLIVGVAVSAKARLNATVLGLHFSVPVLGLIFTVLILVLAVAAMLLARSLVREFRRPQRGWANP